MEARLPEVETLEDWKRLVLYLKEITGGVPIAAKFGASHYLEEEMAIMIEGGIDVLVFDGLEGGTHGGMPVFMDDTGLPILPALCRAASFLKKNELRDKVSLVVGGGLIKPGDFAKCLALGADAVIIGTITAIVQSHTQVTKAFPGSRRPDSYITMAKKKSSIIRTWGQNTLITTFKVVFKRCKCWPGRWGNPACGNWINRIW